MTEEIQKKKDNSVALLIWDRLLDTVDMVLRQCTSGRWLLTIAAGVCLIHYAWVLPITQQDKILDIIKDIVIFYFMVNKVVEMNAKKGESNAQVDNSVVQKPIQQPPA